MILYTFSFKVKVFLVFLVNMETLRVRKCKKSKIFRASISLPSLPLKSLPLYFKVRKYYKISDDTFFRVAQKAHMFIQYGRLLGNYFDLENKTLKLPPNR